MTTEGSLFGEPFNVWEINKLFPNGDTANWRQVVGRIEKKRFGVDMANASIDSEQKGKEKNSDPVVQRDEMRSFLASKQAEISKGIKKPGDGFDEESRGLDYKKVGKDKEALVQFYISIGKKFDAPALYREASILLRKYGMYEEELEVLNSGLRNVSKENTHWEKLNDRRRKLLELIEKKG